MPKGGRTVGDGRCVLVAAGRPWTKPGSAVPTHATKWETHFTRCTRNSSLFSVTITSDSYSLGSRAADTNCQMGSAAGLMSSTRKYPFTFSLLRPKARVARFAWGE